MRPEAIVRMLEDVGAIRQGHFELSSGLHSATYVQCALVLQYPKYAEQLGRALAAEFLDLRDDTCARRSGRARRGCGSADRSKRRPNRIACAHRSVDGIESRKLRPA